MISLQGVKGLGAVTPQPHRADQPHTLNLMDLDPMTPFPKFELVESIATVDRGVNRRRQQIAEPNTAVRMPLDLFIGKFCNAFTQHRRRIPRRHSTSSSLRRRTI